MERVDLEVGSHCAPSVYLPESVIPSASACRADFDHSGVLDGDGDRIVMVDALGRTLDGDQLLYIIANDRLDRGVLEGPVVGTVMTNLGLEHALAARGVKVLRAQVGDRYVMALMKESGGTLGGETSGHILCLDKTTTGDGLVSALQVLAVMKRTGASLAELAAGMKKYPQVLLNVRVARKFDPCVLCSYDIDCEPLADLRTDAGRAQHQQQEHAEGEEHPLFHGRS